MPLLSTIIVNYNTKDLLEKCVRNLLEVYPDQEIIVVDNGSSDGSADMLSLEFSSKISSNKLCLIRAENNGLASGQNLGLKKAGGKYILYIGTDAFPKKGDIDGIIQYMDEHSDVGIVTPKLVLRNGEVDMHAHRGFPTPWASLTYFSRLSKIFPKSRLFNQYYLGYLNMDEPHEIDLCISHFMVVNRKVHEIIGEWDESFFLYGEDVDFCYRTKEAGFKIMYLPNFEVLHYKGASVGIRKETQDISSASAETRKRMKLETTKAMRIFYEKHYLKKYPMWLNRMVLLGTDVLRWARMRGWFLS